MKKVLLASGCYTKDFFAFDFVLPTSGYYTKFHKEGTTVKEYLVFSP